MRSRASAVTSVQSPAREQAHGDDVNGKQVRTRRYAQLFRLIALVAATWFGGAQVAHAACSLAAGVREELSLPPATIAVAHDAPVGATLGSVRVAALHDVPFTCDAGPNLREVRFVTPLQTVRDFDKVFPTSLAGIGMRVTASGGSFAGIDDGPRAAPYSLALPPKAQHLTGFALQVDFIKTGPVQDGVLDAGRLLDVVVGHAELVDVSIPAGAITFVASRQCDTVHAGGMVAAGVGTGGAFSQETLVVTDGCNPSVAAVLQLDQPYRYGRAPIVAHGAPPANGTAHAAAVRAGARRNLLDDGSGAMQDGSGAFAAGTTSSGQFGAGQAGVSHGGDFRR